MKPETEQRMKSAYDFWKQNPHTLVEDLVRQFKTNRRDFGDYLKANGLARPDGRVIGKGSPRQQAIKASYEVASEANETAGWAERYARDTFNQKADKGDFRYYAMKNGLPDLREVERQRQDSPHKVSL
jgi:hypothetical protein